MSSEIQCPPGGRSQGRANWPAMRAGCTFAMTKGHVKARSSSIGWCDGFPYPTRPKCVGSSNSKVRAESVEGGSASMTLDAQPMLWQRALALCEEFKSRQLTLQTLAEELRATPGRDAEARAWLITIAAEELETVVRTLALASTARVLR